jgi:hypothetical protein
MEWQLISDCTIASREFPRGLALIRLFGRFAKVAFILLRGGSREDFMPGDSDDNSRLDDAHYALLGDDASLVRVQAVLSIPMGFGLVGKPTCFSALGLPED